MKINQWASLLGIVVAVALIFVTVRFVVVTANTAVTSATSTFVAPLTTAVPGGVTSRVLDGDDISFKESEIERLADGSFLLIRLSARLLFDPLHAVPDGGGRQIEVAVGGPASADPTEVWVVWSEEVGDFRSDSTFVPSGPRAVAIIDVSQMGDVVGAIKVRVRGGSREMVVHEIGVADWPDQEPKLEAVALESVPVPPSIVLILADDLRADELDLGFGRSLDGWESALETLLIDEGAVFENSFIATPLCCPSRTTFLTGQYPHNHRVHENTWLAGNGYGGWSRFFVEGLESEHLGPWLQQAGYHTALVGKFLNGFPAEVRTPTEEFDRFYIPDGWSEWYGTFTKTDREDNDDSDAYSRFVINENGRRIDYSIDGDAYLTDVESDYAADYINRLAPTGVPFFLYLAPRSPHSPRTPAERHVGSHADLVIVQVPSLPEADLSDKPRHVQRSARSRAAEDVDEVIKATLDMTLSLDELVRNVVEALDRHDALDTTYIFFISDNGRARGEHGVAGKTGPYDEMVRAPLVVRGPGIRPGSTPEHLISNADFAPTVLDIAGQPLPASIDGESLLGVFADEVAIDDWRRAALVEFRADHRFRPPRLDRGQAVYPSYFGIYTSDIAYIEYSTGDVEIYDLINDPFQVDALTLDELVASNGRDRVDELRSLLIALSGCSGTQCVSAARDPPPLAAAFAWWCDAGQCTFDAVGTESDDRHVWDLGDGTEVRGRRVTHQYADPGIVTVTLRIPTPDAPNERTRLTIDTR